MKTGIRHKMRIDLLSIVLITVVLAGTGLQAQQPPVNLGVPVRPMQPPFMPLPPTTPTAPSANYMQPGASVPNDFDIQKNISRIFNSDSLLRRFGIHITVQNQVAILAGTADSWQDYFRAQSDAFAGGARSVDNRLAVRFSY